MEKTERLQLDNKFPTSRLFANACFQQFRESFCADSQVYQMSEADKETLEEVAIQLASEMSFLAAGVQSMGHLLSIASENQAGNIGDGTLIKLGWFLSHIGAEINEHNNLISQTNEILHHAQSETGEAVQ